MEDYLLFNSLVQAEDEDTVVHTLEEAEHSLHNDDIWTPLGMNAGNFSVVGNQQENPAAALIEKVVNSIDAVLMAECYKADTDPTSDAAPGSMTAAVERFFGIRDGRLDNLTSKEHTALADRIHVIASGGRRSPCYTIVDKGEGQTPNKFPDTFLSTSRSSPKIKIDFVQGKFNAGGSGSLQFCGKHNLQLIVSRRQPYAPSEGDDSSDMWGFTVVRRRRPRHGERGSVFVYLAPGGSVFRFSAPFIQVLPGRSSKNRPAPAYQGRLEHGTAVKLYNYRWNARGIATLEARRHLERALHVPCLPFRVSETRDYRANYYETTVVGVWNGIRTGLNDGTESPTMEPGFPATMTLTLPEIGRLPVRIGVWKGAVDKRNFPTGVFFLVNGQVHGQFRGDFISRQLKFDYIRDHILVSVDCTGIERSVAEDLFMASRDRLRKNEHYEDIQGALRRELGSHQGLRDLNAVRRKERVESAGESSTAIVNMVSDLIRADPGLADLFGRGRRVLTAIGPGLVEPFKGRQFPTYFRLAKAPKDGTLRKPCPVNGTVRLEFETDAENGYFDRGSSPGELRVEPGTDLIEASHLWNGRFSVRFRVPWDARPGDITPIRFAVTDVERVARGPFVTTFDLIATPEVDRRTLAGNAGRDRDRGSQRDPTGTQNQASLDLPTPIPINRKRWGTVGIDGPYDAFRLKVAPDGGYDFYVNEDCAWLVTEMADRSNDAEQVKHWFVWGLALAALGMLRQANALVDAREGEPMAKPEGSGPDLEGVARACDGLARVIIPMFRVLHEGPPGRQGVDVDENLPMSPT